MDNNRDEQLWQTAKKRAKFKKSLFSYIVINAFLWAIYWMTTGRHHPFEIKASVWPIWVMLGWGIGLAFQYFEAYQNGQEDLVQKEYEKLKQEQR